MRKAGIVVTTWVAAVSLTGLVFAGDKTSASGRTPAAERPAKVSVVTVRPVSDIPQAGYDKVVTDGGETIYVGKDILFTGTDVTATAAGLDGNSLSLTVTGGKGVNVPGRVAVFVDGGFAGAAVATKAGNGTITLAGLAPAQTARLTQHLILSPEPTGALITLVPDSNRIEPGQTVEVKAFVDGATDLRAYQVAVDITGGTQGSFTIKDMFVDSNHPDWVFADMQAVSAANRTGGRLMGALYTGGTNVSSRKYAGTIILEASTDALGSFSIGLRQTQETTLRNPDSVPISYVATAPVAVEVSPRVAPGSRR